MLVSPEQKTDGKNYLLKTGAMQEKMPSATRTRVVGSGDFVVGKTGVFPVGETGICCVAAATVFSVDGAVITGVPVPGISPLISGGTSVLSSANARS